MHKRIFQDQALLFDCNKHTFCKKKKKQGEVSTYLIIKRKAFFFKRRVRAAEEKVLKLCKFTFIKMNELTLSGVLVFKFEFPARVCRSSRNWQIDKFSPLMIALLEFSCYKRCNNATLRLHRDLKMRIGCFRRFNGIAGNRGKFSPKKLSIKFRKGGKNRS